MNNTLLENREYIDPHEQSPQEGDLVTLSDFNFYWRVTKVARDNSVVYLRSVVGGRSGIISPGRLKAVYRDPSQPATIDWTQAYDEEL